MKRHFLVSIFILMLYVIPAFSAEKMRVAILDFKPAGLPKMVARVISNMIRSDMIKMNKFIVVERAQMDAVLNEQGFQMTGCTDESCAVKFGRLMSANKILIGDVGKVGKSIVITVRIVDVEKGISEFAEKETAPSEDELHAAASRLTKRLAESIEEALKITIPTGYYMRSIVPGWGQFYAGKPIKGYAFAGSFGAALIFSIWAHLDYINKKSDYEDLPADQPQSKYDDKYNAAKSAEKISMISAGLVGIIYIANWIDVLFFTKDEYTSKKTSYINKNVYFDFAFYNNYFIQNNNEKSIQIKVNYLF